MTAVGDRPGVFPQQDCRGVIVAGLHEMSVLEDLRLQLDDVCSSRAGRRCVGVR